MPKVLLLTVPIPDDHGPEHLERAIGSIRHWADNVALEEIEHSLWSYEEGEVLSFVEDD